MHKSVITPRGMESLRPIGGRQYVGGSTTVSGLGELDDGRNDRALAGILNCLPAFVECVLLGDD